MLQGVTPKISDLRLAHVRRAHRRNKERLGKEREGKRYFPMSHQVGRSGRSHCRPAAPVKSKSELTGSQQHDRIQNDDENGGNPKGKAEAGNSVQHQVAFRWPKSHRRKPMMPAAAPTKMKTANLPRTLKSPVFAAAAAAPPTISPASPYSATL